MPAGLSRSSVSPECRSQSRPEERREFGIDLLEMAADGLEQSLARLGERHASGRAREQAHAEPSFQPADRLAEAGLRNSELCGRAREAPCAGAKAAKLAVVFALREGSGAVTKNLRGTAVN